MLNVYRETFIRFIELKDSCGNIEVKVSFLQKIVSALLSIFSTDIISTLSNLLIEDSEIMEIKELSKKYCKIIDGYQENDMEDIIESLNALFYFLTKNYMSDSEYYVPDKKLFSRMISRLINNFEQDDHSLEYIDFIQLDQLYVDILTRPLILLNLYISSINQIDNAVSYYYNNLFNSTLSPNQAISNYIPIFNKILMKVSKILI